MFGTTGDKESIGRGAPDTYPVSASSGKLQAIQDFVSGSLDSVGRFINVLKGREPAVAATSRNAPLPIQAQGIGGFLTGSTGLLLFAAIGLGLLAILWPRK